jgi:hypothetical protein
MRMIASIDQAAGLGTGVATAALALFRELQVPGSLLLPEQQQQHESKAMNRSTSSEAEFVLVAGRSTATGTRALRVLKLYHPPLSFPSSSLLSFSVMADTDQCLLSYRAGLRPIATCSPSNFDLALPFGGEKVFDYNSPTCAADIRAYTRNTLAYVLHCISLANTTQLCYGAIGRAGGRYVSLEPFRESITAARPTVESSWLMVLTVFGRKVALDGAYGRDARPGDREFGTRVFAAVRALLDRGLIDAHPVKTMAGGWAGVITGVDIIRSQTFLGYKLVYAM